MRKTLISIATLLLASGVASAGGSKGSVGVGAQYNLFGIGGPSFAYDAGQFHAGAAIGFDSFYANAGDNTKTTELNIGGDFYWHVHQTAMSDFGVGGGFGFENINRPGTAADESDVYIDLGAQIRMFVVSNVSLDATLGLGIATADADEVQLTADPLAALGLHYYFF